MAATVHLALLLDNLFMQYNMCVVSAGRRRLAHGLAVIDATIVCVCLECFWPQTMYGV